MSEPWPHSCQHLMSHRCLSSLGWSFSLLVHQIVFPGWEGGVCVSVLRDGRGSGGDVLSRPHSVRVSWTCPQGSSRGGGGGSFPSRESDGHHCWPCHTEPMPSDIPFLELYLCKYLCITKWLLIYFSVLKTGIDKDVHYVNLRILKTHRNMFSKTVEVVVRTIPKVTHLNSSWSLQVILWEES